MGNIKKEHESIKARQREVCAPYSESRPSEVTEVPWIYAKNKTGNYPAATSKSGKWLIFVNVANIDAFWAKIKRATESGRLGQDSKVATAWENPNAQDPRKRVVCVYTCDWTNEKDVRRVRAELKSLGVEWKISYKSDEDTLKGKYRVTGATRISKYYE